MKEPEGTGAIQPEEKETYGNISGRVSGTERAWLQSTEREDGHTGQILVQNMKKLLDYPKTAQGTSDQIACTSHLESGKPRLKPQLPAELQ